MKINSFEELQGILKNKPINKGQFESKTQTIITLALLPLFFFVLIPSAIFFSVAKILLKLPSLILKKLGLITDAPKKVLIPQTEQIVVKPKTERTYDLVLYGATGYTGFFCAEYLATNYQLNQPLRWAIAGRSSQKLKEVQEKLIKINGSLKNLPILVADSEDIEALTKLVNSTKVVISTAGPFAQYSTNLVTLCAQYGTDYCDITGEFDWVRDMIEINQKVAFKTKARLVNCCGLDSLPWDLLTLSISKELTKKKTSLKNIKIYSDFLFNPSGGTLATIIGMLENPAVLLPRKIDPIVNLIGGMEQSKNKFIPKVQLLPNYDETVKATTGFSLTMAGNQEIVKRSNALLNYNNEFTYAEIQNYKSFQNWFNMTFLIYIGITCLLIPPLKYIMQKFLIYKPGQGPSESFREKGYLTVRGVGVGEDKTQVEVQELYFVKEPGYVDTARMLVESGITLALEKQLDQYNGGFYTPASLQGMFVLKRLLDTGCYLNKL